MDGSRYIFVVFYSPWDTASKDLMPELEAVGEEAGAQDNLLLVKANGEDNEKLKEKFGQHPKVCDATFAKEFLSLEYVF